MCMNIEYKENLKNTSNAAVSINLVSIRCKLYIKNNPNPVCNMNIMNNFGSLNSWKFNLNVIEYSFSHTIFRSSSMKEMKSERNVNKH